MKYQGLVFITAPQHTTIIRFKQEFPTLDRDFDYNTTIITWAAQESFPMEKLLPGQLIPDNCQNHCHVQKPKVKQEQEEDYKRLSAIEKTKYMNALEWGAETTSCSVN